MGSCRKLMKNVNLYILIYCCNKFVTQTIEAKASSNELNKLVKNDQQHS